MTSSTHDDADTPDLTHLPSGEREWSEFIRRVAPAGDLHERHFLEMKSDVDPTSKEGAAKIAKYILGAANRDPERAAKYLGGYAVMILGVSKAEVRGLERFEAKDFVGRVQSYVGEPGPSWDFHRIRVDDDRDVIVITIVPPQPGDQIWPCCREGFGLIDGRVYIRADGETREANSGEFRALLARAAVAASEARPDLAVALNGTVRRFGCDVSSVVDEYISRERQRLEAHAPKPRSAPTPTARQNPISGYDFLSASSAADSITRMFGPVTKPDSRSLKEYLAEIDDWEEKARNAFRRFAFKFAVAFSDGARIEACSQSYLEDVKIKIRLDGPVHGLERPDLPPINDLPKPPRPWGPQTTPHPLVVDLDRYGLNIPNVARYSAPPLHSRYDHIEIDESNSVDLTVMVGELRPQEEYVSRDELTLYVAHDYAGSTITGTWTATAKNHHEQYSGEFQLEVGDIIDVTDALREHLQPAHGDD
jgi:hypothetical protein